MLPFGELKVDIRRNPKPICKLIELAAMKAYETTHFNITGVEHNQVPRFVHQSMHLKKLREFFMKDQIFRAFLFGLDRKDERYILQETKTMKFYAGDRVIRKGMRDRALYFVISGEFFTLDGHQTIFRQGAVIGSE